MLLGWGFFVLLVLPVLPAKAITATQPQAQIDSLIKQIAVLQAELASLQAWCLNYNAQYGCQTPPEKYITITSPKGGEKWIKGSKHKITWKTNLSGNVVINLVSGNNKYKIANVKGSLGSYTWKTGFTSSEAKILPGSNYKIEIYDPNNPSNIQSFSNYFSIIFGQLSIASSRFIF